MEEKIRGQLRQRTCAKGQGADDLCEHSCRQTFETKKEKKRQGSYFFCLFSLFLLVPWTWFRSPPTDDPVLFGFASNENNNNNNKHIIIMPKGKERKRREKNTSFLFLFPSSPPNPICNPPTPFLRTISY